MENFLSNILGTISSIFRVGNGANQLILKNNSGTLELKDKDDSVYKVMRGANPVLPNDFVTLGYIQDIEGWLQVDRQADCTSAIPNNTSSAGYVICTTAGSGVAIGDILRDNGLNDGQPMDILTARNGRTIITTIALTGGTITFDNDSGYTWDGENATPYWKKVFDIGSVSGAVRKIKITCGTNATYESTALIPLNNEIDKMKIKVSAAYTAGATVKIGYTEDDDALLSTTDISLQETGEYIIEFVNKVWHSADRAVLVTISDTPADGAMAVEVFYCNPNA